MIQRCYSARVLLACFVLLSLLNVGPWSRAALAEETDILIYGATPSGIAAALAAGRAGQQVILVEPTSRLGGLTTSGLSHTDFHSLESLTGSFLEFARRVESFYAQQYGKDSPQVKDCYHGTFAEPKVNLAVFEQMLSDVSSITVLKNLRLAAVALEEATIGSRIHSVTFQGLESESLVCQAKVFIDATYEGDLMAAAKVPYRVGREGRDEYNESLAPEQADSQLQAYNFRFIMTQDPGNRVTPVAPPHYRREDFVDVLPVLRSGKIKKIFGYPKNCIFKAHLPPLPNGKYDINDVSNGLVRLSLPGKNLGWPDGDLQTRQAIYAEHLRDQVGLLYFLQNDPEVPDAFRQEALSWGWCRDEFAETNHWPPQLYVREARRMTGQYVFAQQDSEHAPGDARAKLHQDAIAMGDYGNNCHGTFHEGPRFGGKHTGEFYNPVPPYQIPYGVLLPRAVSNLLVPVAVSSTHVGFCALRLEPIWMSLGQASGHAAVLANTGNINVQDVDVQALQRRLHGDGSATIYTSDVLPGDPDFTAVQWWGTLGGLHGLAPMPSKPGQRGENLHGQYFKANPGHAVELAAPLEPSLFARWFELAKRQGLPDTKLATIPRTNRGDFIRAVYKMSM